MASTKDVQDILGLPRSDGAPKPSPILKRQKTAPLKRLTGINREVQALHGDRPPPVSVIQADKAYKAKPQKDFIVRPWEVTSFVNPARNDGLVLKHWRRKPRRPLPVANDGVDAMEDVEDRDPKLEADYEFAKYNIQISGPQYTEAQYNERLRSDDWSKEETDYLVDMVKEYYQRWYLIADRWDFQPKAQTNGASTSAEDDPSKPLASPPKTRTIEDMKARYYHISAICMEMNMVGGPANMNEAEFAQYQILEKYDPAQDTKRKQIASALLLRSHDEVKEEEYLVTELQRIVLTQRRFEAEREELRARLEKPQSTSTGAQYQTSAQLNALFNQLLAADKNKKRGRLSLNASDVIPSPVTNGTTNGTPVGHRDSISGAQQKKGAATAGSAQQPTRSLSPRSEARFGITTHERLTSGVTFRSDKIQKLRQAKSGAQTQKITSALAELQVPELLVLPTARVCDAFEGLISGITKLLDARKVLEKEEGEIRVAAALKAERERRERGETGPAQVGGAAEAEPAEDGADVSMAEADGEDEDADANGEENGDGEAEGDADGDGDDDEDADADRDADGDADGDGDEDDMKDEEPDEDEYARPKSSSGAPAESGRTHKRSASVLSAASNKSIKRSRR